VYDLKEKVYKRVGNDKRYIKKCTSCERLEYHKELQQENLKKLINKFKRELIEAVIGPQ
jgi:acetyl-CoA carboxylase beta subunit